MTSPLAAETLVCTQCDRAFESLPSKHFSRSEAEILTTFALARAGL